MKKCTVETVHEVRSPPTSSKCVYKPKSFPDEIAKAGERVIIELCGRKQHDTLNKLRYVKYIQKVTSSTKATLPSFLPPTSSAARDTVPSELFTRFSSGCIVQMKTALR